MLVGSDSVTQLLADAVEDTLSEEAALEKDEFAITGLSVTGSEATVAYRATAPVRLIVAVYDDPTGQMVACAMANTEKSGTAQEAEATFQLDNIPAYFTARAFMVDQTTGRPLCGCFTNSLYTQAMQELERSTTDDYDPDLVLNLDDNTSTNFVVFQSGTKVVDYQADSNQVEDLGDGQYRITNADETVRNLQVGDTLALENEDGSVLLVKVKTVTASGQTVTVTDDTVADLSDVFDVIKIEGGVREPGEESQDAELLDDSARLMEGDSLESGLEGKVIKKVELEEKLDGVTFHVDGSVTLSAYIKLYLSKDEKYIEASVTLSGTVTSSITASTGRMTLNLLPDIVSLSPVPGVFISIMPAIVFEATAELSFHATISTTLGGAYVQDHFENRSKAPSFSKCNVSLEGKLYLGFSLEPKVKVLSDKIGEVKLTAQLGITFTTSQKLVDLVERTHACEHCLEGNASIGLEVTASAKFLKILDVTHELINHVFASRDYYYSFDYHDYAFTKCPHENHLVKITVWNVDKGVKAGAKVSVSGVSTRGAALEKNLTTDRDGEAKIYLPDGDYTFYTEDKDQDAYASTTLAVTEEQTINLWLEKNTYPVTVSVVNEDGEPVSGATIAGTGKAFSPVTGSGGTARFTLTAGTYTLSVSKNGGTPVETTCVVTNGPVAVSVVLPEPEYQVAVTAKDINGNLLPGAKIQVPELDLHLTANENGVCSFQAKNDTYTLAGESADGLYTHRTKRGPGSDPGFDQADRDGPGDAAGPGGRSGFQCSHRRNRPGCGPKNRLQRHCRDGAGKGKLYLHDQ